MSVQEARRALAAQSLSPVELAEAVLSQAERLNPHLGAYFELDADGVLAQAHAVSRRAEAGPLFGIPICVKAVIDVAGVPTTAGAAQWQRMPSHDATVVHRLRAAGAILIAQGHTNEFAYGIDGRNPHWGDAHNPRDRSRLAGGSSSGPAVATAAGMALGGVGTDTSGSIRVPASFCGLVGLRPTPGAIPIRGVVPLAPSYDTVGLLARDVADAEILFDVVANRRARRPGSKREAHSADAPADHDLAGLRVGLLEQLVDVVEQYAAVGIIESARRLEAAGAALEPVTLDGLERAVEIHQVIQQAEAAHVHEPWFAAQKRYYSEPVRTRLQNGRSLTATAYLAAREARARLARQASEKLKQLHVLLAPTTPVVAPLGNASEVTINGVRHPLRAALMSCVIPTTQLATPVVSVPVGRYQGLPYGMQIITRPFDERLALRVARACEVARGPASDRSIGGLGDSSSER